MEIKFGTAGWSYKDWEGIVYNRASSGLETIAQYLDMVEVNSSFYHIPSEETVQAWPRRTEHNPDFTFVLKLWQGFTHADSWSEKDEASFSGICRILKNQDKLGGVLAQFPFFFEYSSDSMKRINTLSSLFGENNLFYEFRHASWFDRQAVSEVENSGGVFCNIDIPGGEKTFNLTEKRSSRGGYLRLHGRNREAWFSKEAGRDQKYDYLYTEEEIETVVNRIRRISEKAGPVFVAANNHYKGKAVANSLQLKSLAEGRKVDAPGNLVLEYPVLCTYTKDRGLFSA